MLRLLARVEIDGMENIPPEGKACIAVSNHIGRLDAMLVFVLAERDDIVMFVAEKYRTSSFWRFFVKRLDAVWLDRFSLDLNAFRTVQKRLKQGELLAMAPEGTRSKSGKLIAAKPGAAYLAAKAQVPIVPIGATGTEDAVVLARWRRAKRLDIKVKIGKPFVLPPVPRRDRDAFLAKATDEIMCRIALELPDQYHGEYANHDRLFALREAVEAGTLSETAAL